MSARSQNLVIFGAAGDLTKRKLLPALYNLAAHGLLRPECAVIGVAEELRGQVPVGFVVLKAGASREAADIECPPTGTVGAAGYGGVTGA